MKWYLSMHKALGCGYIHDKVIFIMFHCCVSKSRQNIGGSMRRHIKQMAQRMPKTDFVLPKSLYLLCNFPSHHHQHPNHDKSRRERSSHREAGRQGGFILRSNFYAKREILFYINSSNDNTNEAGKRGKKRGGEICLSS